MAKPSKKQSKPSKSNSSVNILNNKVVYIGLFIITLVLYGNTLSHDFALDDAIVITENEFTQKGIAGIWDILSKDTFHGFFGEAGKDKLVSGGRYRPFTLVMFAVEHMFGSGPFLHHLLNVIYYFLLGVVVFLFGRNIFSQKFNPREATLGGVVMAILFIVHPIHTEAVANIKGRDEIMALLGSLFALYWLTRKGFDDLKDKDYLIAGASFFVGLLSKENAITYTLVIPLVAYLFYKKSISESLKIGLPFFGVAFLFILIRTLVIGFDLGSEPSMELMNNPYIKIVNGSYVPFAGSEKLSTIFYTLFKYLQLLVIPHPLTHDYYPFHVGLAKWSNPISLLGLFSFVGIGIIGILGLLKRKAWAFFPIYFLATISIVSNIVFPIGTHMSERFLFMPSLGFFGLVAYLLLRIDHKNKRKVALYVIGAVTVLFSILTISRNTVWKDNYTLFTTDAKTSTKSAKVNNAAGGAISERLQGMQDGPQKTELVNTALGHLNNAIEVHPNYVNAYLLKGNVLFYNYQFDEAIAQYQHCLKIDPVYQEANNNILLAYRSAGRYYGEQKNDLNRSLGYLQKAISLDPDDFETNRLIGTCYGIMGNHPLALNHFKKCTELQPNNANILVSYGKALSMSGNPAEAQQVFARARQIDPAVIIN